MNVYRATYRNLACNPTEQEEIYLDAETFDEARLQADDYASQHIFEVVLQALEKLPDDP